MTKIVGKGRVSKLVPGFRMQIVSERRVGKPQDATLRNARASKARDEKLSVRVAQIEKYLNHLVPGWRKKP